VDLQVGFEYLKAGAASIQCKTERESYSVLLIKMPLSFWLIKYYAIKSVKKTGSGHKGNLSLSENVKVSIFQISSSSREWNLPATKKLQSHVVSLWAGFTCLIFRMNAN
jgi:hypothetical protein